MGYLRSVGCVFATTSVSLVLLMVLPVAEAGRRLRGPNVCYHYDYGRHCCSGFTEVDGFCVLSKKSDTENKEGIRKVVFAPKPNTQDVISHTKFDDYGRPINVLYSHGRQESVSNARVATVDSQSSAAVRNEQTDISQPAVYYKPVDMEVVRRRLQLAITTPTTPAATVRLSESSTERPKLRFQSTERPKLRFQSDPDQIKRWDWENNKWKFHDREDFTKQVAVGRVNDNFFKAVKLSHTPGSERQVSRAATESVAQLRQRQLISIPIDSINSGTDYRSNTASSRADNPTTDTNADETPLVFNSNGQPSEVPDVAPIMTVGPEEPEVIFFPACPEGYSLVKSQEGGDFCYPVTGLTGPEAPDSIGYRRQPERAPVRGDGALTCPPGHDLRSSEYGDACVPFDWQPCSGEPNCNHNDQPIVNPVVLVDCQTAGGQLLPCENPTYIPQNTGATGRSCLEGGCEPCSEPGCGNPGTGVIFGELVDCEGGVGEGCGGEMITSDDCIDFDGRPCSETLPLGSRCQNGGSLSSTGFCICQPGFVGENCEHDVDECRAEGGLSGLCSYQCLNTVGSFKCLCPAGAVLAQDGLSCIFITCPKCMHGGYCDENSNRCVCPAGFTGEICETDINECNVPGVCSHQCRNTFGSYRCLCQQGYTLLSDGHTCEDFRCYPKCVNGGVCDRNRCICPDGFSGIICQFNNRL